MRTPAASRAAHVQLNSIGDLHRSPAGCRLYVRVAWLLLMCKSTGYRGLQRKCGVRRGWGTAARSGHSPERGGHHRAWQARCQAHRAESPRPAQCNMHVGSATQTLTYVALCAAHNTSRRGATSTWAEACKLGGHKLCTRLWLYMTTGRLGGTRAHCHAWVLPLAVHACVLVQGRSGHHSYACRALAGCQGVRGPHVQRGECPASCGQHRHGM